MRTHEPFYLLAVNLHRRANAQHLLDRLSVKPLWLPQLGNIFVLHHCYVQQVA
ncbi:MAG: hypothetical protein NZ520_04670 [bacterium]|nr:hypothetical protein [bacterium]